MNKLKDDIAVITGASRGIGRAIALAFSEKGINLALFGRDKTKLSEVKEDCEKFGLNVLIFSGDVGNEQFVNSSIDEVMNKFGKIDHLINNAGIAHFGKFIDSSLTEFKEQVNTNLYGVYNFTKAVLPDMIRKRSGSIINISSLAGKNGFVGGSLYAATKHGLMGMTKCLMLEVREHNIRVASVCPGSVGTDLILNTALSPLYPEKILSPSDVAEVVLSILNLPPRALISEVEVRPTNPK